MQKMKGFIDKMRLKKNNQGVSYTIFKHKKNTTVDLTDALNYTWLPTQEYEKFLTDGRCPNKGLSTFFPYFKEHTKDENMKKILTIEEFENYFDKMIDMYLEKIITDFLLQEDTSKTFENFYTYLGREKGFIIDATDKRDIQLKYEQLHKEYLKVKNKNEFGLEFKDIDEQLTKIFGYTTIGDGSFLYKRDSIESSGIAKYNNAVESTTYENIKPTEQNLFAAILSEKNIAYAYTILNRSKTIVELGPGGVSKLLDNLQLVVGGKDQLQWTLKDKKIKLLDIASEGYVGIKKQLNDIVEKEITEGIEGGMTDETSSAYNNDNQTSYFMFGGTIGNFTLDEIQKILKNMRSKNPLKSSHIFMMYFTAPDKEKLTEPEYEKAVARLESMYGGGDKQSPEYNPGMEDFILSGFEALGLPRYIQDENNKQIPQYEYVVQYEKSSESNPARIKLGIKLLHDIKITTQTGRIFRGETNQYLRGVQSARFTKEDFEKLAKKSGYSMPIQVDDNGVAVAVLQSKLGINDRFKKIRNVGYSILIGSTLLGGRMLTKNILHQKEVERQQQKIDTDFVSKQKIFFYSGQGHGYYETSTDKEKIEYIDKLKDEIYENIVIRYDIKQDKEEIKKLIKLYIKDKEILGKFANTDNHTSNVFEVSDNFIKKFSDIFVEDGINKVPYEQFKEYEQYFRDLITNPNISDENIINLSGDQGTLVSTSTYIPSPYNGKTTYYSSFDIQCIKNGKKRQLEDQKLFQVEDENDYHIKQYIGSSVDIKSHYIKDGYLYVKRWKDTKYNYIKVRAHGYEEEKKIDPSIVAYDYFYQSRKVISQIYSKFGNIYRGMVGIHDREKNQTYRWKKDAIKMLIIADLLKTGLLDKINPENTKEILNYLQGFVKRNSATIQKEGITTIPYDMHVRQYKEAFENTHTVQSGDMREVISYNERDNYKFTYIGKYYTKEGIEYSIAQVTIDGKTYLFARNAEEDVDTYSTEEGYKVTSVNYYLSRGREVVKDYYTNQINK